MKIQEKIIAVVLALGILVFSGMNAVKQTVVQVPEQEPITIGGSVTPTAFLTASTSRMVIGDDLSTTVLSASQSRRFARFCNDSETQRMYLFFNGTVVTATTTADVILDVRGSEHPCYEISDGNRYIGTVQAKTETSSTTKEFIVTTLP